MSEYKWIHFKEIASYYSNEQRFIKFKEWYYDKSSAVYKPCEGTTYTLVNLDNIESLIVDFNDDMVQVLGMVGKFFV